MLMQTPTLCICLSQYTHTHTHTHTHCGVRRVPTPALTPARTSRCYRHNEDGERDGEQDRQRERERERERDGGVDGGKRGPEGLCTAVLPSYRIIPHPVH